MLAPGTPGDPVQIIVVRDLADFIVQAIEQNATGVFNAVGPAAPLPMGDLLGACKRVSGYDTEFAWADLDFITEHGISAWTDMPAWVPPVGDSAGFGQRSNERAKKAGMTFLPISETIRDTLAWWDTLPAERREKLRAGISPEREAEALKALNESR